jgi:hypothetical protein
MDPVPTRSRLPEKELPVTNARVGRKTRRGVIKENHLLSSRAFDESITPLLSREPIKQSYSSNGLHMARGGHKVFADLKQTLLLNKMPMCRRSPIRVGRSPNRGYSSAFSLLRSHWEGF